MADKSKIEWTESTWNPAVGCTKVSEGCRNCYAERMAVRLACMGKRKYQSVVLGGRWTGKVFCDDESLTIPLRWKKPRMIFVCSMGDLFHEDVPDEFIYRVMHIMGQEAHHHTYQVLTKRAERQRDFLQKFYADGRIPSRNIWHGVTVESDDNRNRLDYLRQTPAVVRFVSYEPAVGPLNLIHIAPEVIGGDPAECICDYLTDMGEPRLDWVICGGESGPGARPMHPDWARKVRDDCKAAGVAFFMKQWGEWVPITEKARWCGISDHKKLHDLGDGTVIYRVGKKKAGRLLDGVEHDAMPALDGKGGE